MNELIGTGIIDGEETKIYLICVRYGYYVTDESISTDRAIGWFITSKSALDYCIANIENFKQIN